jgi:glycosyltransferase involved in cell wall biosynthesis
LPTALVEAEAKRRPVVSADDVGAREVAHDDDRALVVPLRLIEALADALSRILEQTVLADRLHHSGYNRLLNGFTNKVVLARTVAVFQSHEPEISFTCGREAERICP